jgi:NADPH2:quinone reductase
MFTFAAMKAYVLSRHGSAAILQPQEVPEPQPGPGEVRVRVQHLGINFAEILSRRGQYGWAPKLPYTLGMEAYGHISAVGPDVARSVGEPVIAGAQYGSYAEQMIVPAYMALPPPDHFTPEENAAFLVNYMTAWVGLMKLARLQPTDAVLVNAAAGGVGTAAVQLAKARGCTVFGTASHPNKLALLDRLSVDHPINYQEQDFEAVVRETQHGGGVDVVLELVGGETFRKSQALLNPFGRLVIAGMAGLKWNKRNPLTWPRMLRNIPLINPLQMAQRSSGLMATHIGYLIRNPEVVQTEWAALGDYVREHSIRPVISAVFPFDQLPHAHHFVESRQSHGKVVVSLE